MEKVYSVGALTRSIRKNLLANNERLKDVWIEGEISGWRRYSSGHVYFTLKDAEAQINAVLFSFHAAGCEPAFRKVVAQGADAVNGLRVQIAGELDLNMSQGRYSLKALRIRLSGMGEKMAQFNALKAKLEAEGLNKLDHPELRRPLPFLPHRIGIVTSPEGAVIHDMCTVLTRRFPNVQIRLFPTKVQGDGTAAMVAAGVAYFNALAADPNADWRPDVLIVGRGGGSAEDLWAFNEEAAVYAVAHAAVPVISAVGHESDTMLCDYVADLRAGTPSIAAECAVPVKSDLSARVVDASARLVKAPMRQVETCTQQVDYLSLKLTQAPRGVLAQTELRLDRASSRLAPALKDSVAQMEKELQRLALRLEPPVRSACENAAHRVDRASSRLTLLDPLGVLKRGYSLTMDGDGHVVQSVDGLAEGQTLRTRLADGWISSAVVLTEKETA